MTREALAFRFETNTFVDWRLLITRNQVRGLVSVVCRLPRTPFRGLKVSGVCLRCVSGREGRETNERNGIKS